MSDIKNSWRLLCVHVVTALVSRGYVDQPFLSEVQEVQYVRALSVNYLRNDTKLNYCDLVGTGRLDGGGK